jgi:hypothetical protein
LILPIPATCYTFGTFLPTYLGIHRAGPGRQQLRTYSPAALIAGSVGIRLTF